jgi:pyruvyl transferase EpsO
MSGTLKFLSDYKIRRLQTSAYFNYDPNWAEAGVPIVLQGGGNLGDLYDGPQGVRESVISRCVTNRIVILPQTIHFSSPENYEACCSLFSKHPDLHIFVRDTRSAALAKRMTPNVYLSPDMAHQLWPMTTAQRPKFDQLAFKRTDDERSGSAATDEGHSIDWPTLIGWHGAAVRIYAKIGKLPFLRKSKSAANIHSEIWCHYAKHLESLSASHFSQYKEVETDRLHGHILSSLLGIENVVSDNSYGKNGGYIRCWTHTSDHVTLVEQTEHGQD